MRTPSDLIGEAEQERERALERLYKHVSQAARDLRDVRKATKKRDRMAKKHAEAMERDGLGMIREEAAELAKDTPGPKGWGGTLGRT